MVLLGTGWEALSSLPSYAITLATGATASTISIAGSISPASKEVDGAAGLLQRGFFIPTPPWPKTQRRDCLSTANSCRLLETFEEVETLLF